MSQEHADLARFMEDAISRRDLKALETTLHPEFEFHSVLAASEGAVYRGAKNGMSQYFADIDAVWERFQIELKEVREAGAQVVVIWRVKASSRHGVPLDQLMGRVWTWRDGLPWRNVSYTDPRAALEAVGLRE